MDNSTSRLVQRAKWLKLITDYAFRGAESKTIKIKAAAELLTPYRDQFIGTAKFYKLLRVMEELIDRIDRSDDESVTQVFVVFQRAIPSLMYEIENERD